jgi:hypothetical protein
MILRLVFVTLLPVALGAQVGCSDDCGTSCGAPAAFISRDGLPHDARATLCIEDDCRDLVEDPTWDAWSGFTYEVPQEDSHVRAAVRDADGNVLATFDGVGRPGRCSCGVIDLRLESDELVWRRD